MESRKPRVTPEKRLWPDKVVFLLEFDGFLIGKNAQPRFPIDDSERNRAVVNRVHRLMIIDGWDKP